MSEGVKIIYLPAPEKILTQVQLGNIFAQYSEKDSIIIAFRQVLQQHFALAAVDAADDGLTERKAGHAGGRIAEISDLTTELTELLKAGEAERTGRDSARNEKRKRR